MNFKRIIAFVSVLAMSCSVFSGFPTGTFDIDWNFNADATDSIVIDETNFPDANFRSYLSTTFDSDSDGVFSAEEIADVSVIDVNYKGVSSIKGIEYLTALKTLRARNNSITSMDLSNNTKLESLTCGYNDLTSLDLSSNTALTYLFCPNNSLTSLNVSKCVNLEDLYCYGNQLTSLDISKNTLLDTLNCSDNLLTTLDISKNTNLTNLQCSENQISNLDISYNTALTELRCSTNPLISLDLSKNTLLEALYCNDNQLTSLDLSNQTKLKSLYCDDNQITSLDLTNNTSLTSFTCRFNKLTELNIGSCAALESFACYGNEINKLDLSKNTALKTMDCGRNNLKVLDISNCTNLQSLSCSSNQLTWLDISNCPNLSSVSCAINEYNIGTISETAKTFDLSRLPEGFDMAKASNWQGATYEDGMLTNIEGVYGHTVEYTYDIGLGQTKEFALRFAYGDGIFEYDDMEFYNDATTYYAENCASSLPVAYISFYYNNGLTWHKQNIGSWLSVSSAITPDVTLDVNTVSTGGSESVSPFDLYWSAYNASMPTCEFVYTYRFDMTKINKLFSRLNAITGYGLSYVEDFDLFVNILYDENGNAIDLGSFTCKIAQRGDANLDHSVDAKDAAAIAKYSAESSISTNPDDIIINGNDNELGVFVADINGDGTIDAKDAANAAKFSSQKALYSPDIPDAQSYYEIWNNILN